MKKTAIKTKKSFKKIGFFTKRFLLDEETPYVHLLPLITVIQIVFGIIWEPYLITYNTATAFIIIIIVLSIGVVIFAGVLPIALKGKRRRYHKSIFLLTIILEIIILFAIIYLLIYSRDRSSFNFIANNEDSLFLTFLYFSVITFTTLGYGDIQPVSILARSVVMIEVLLFVVYISIILLSINKDRSTQTHE